MITIEELKTYEQTETKLNEVCLEWAKQNLDKSQRYNGWTCASYGYIGIKYSCNEIVNNIESETDYGVIISWEKLIEFAKTLEL